MTKSTTKVVSTIENQRGKVGVNISLTYADFGDPFADAIKSECEVFVREMEKKYMPERFGNGENN